MARLGDIVTIQASSKQLSGNSFWLLNLDMVEQQTGNIIDYHYVSADCLNGSIIQFDSDTVLYSKLRPNLNKVVLPQTDGYATSEMLPLKPDSQKITREYLAEFLRSDGFVTWAVSKTAGAKMPRLGTKELLNAEIPLPSLDEQGQIAQLFSQTNKLISLRKRQLAKLDKLVKARFVELFENSNYPVIRLGEVCTKITDGTHKTPTYLESGITFISAKNIVNGELGFSDIKYISEQEYSEIQKRCQTELGDILLSKSGSLGSPVIVKTTQKLGLFESLAVIKYDRDRLLPEFLCEQLKTDIIQRQFKVGTKGVAIKHLHLGVIADTGIIVPPLGEQKQFAAFVEQADKSKSVIQKSLDELETLKKSLMQKYFG